MIKIGAKVVGHARYVAFQMAEMAVPRDLFADILRMIAELQPSQVASKTQCVWVAVSEIETTGEVCLDAAELEIFQRLRGIRRPTAPSTRPAGSTGLPEPVSRGRIGSKRRPSGE